VIAIRDLRVRRGGSLVLGALSLEMVAGSVTGLLGPSGSGKSTLIRAIVGVQIAEGGEVVVLGSPAGSPPFIFPQLLLCGLFAPRDQMGRALELASWAMPLTYAYDALDRTVRAVYGARLAVDVAVALGLARLALAAGAAILRRRTP
jgi:ABC-type cobalamin/Fe3+-siderophores transport system ATPase subunit